MAVIESVVFEPQTWDVPGPVTVKATMSDGSQETLFMYFPDELHFSREDLVGRSVEDARALRHQRDVGWLES